MKYLKVLGHPHNPRSAGVSSRTLGGKYYPQRGGNIPPGAFTCSHWPEWGGGALCIICVRNWRHLTFDIALWPFNGHPRSLSLAYPHTWVSGLNWRVFQVSWDPETKCMTLFHIGMFLALLYDIPSQSVNVNHRHWPGLPSGGFSDEGDVVSFRDTYLTKIG